MRVKPLFVPAIVIITLMGTILIAQFAGAWIVTGRSTIQLESLAPADIKGWMSLQQVIDGVKIPKDELYALVGIPVDIPTTTALKDLEKLIPGFETSMVRDALAARVATPQPTASN